MVIRGRLYEAVPYHRQQALGLTLAMSSVAMSSVLCSGDGDGMEEDGAAVGAADTDALVHHRLAVATGGVGMDEDVDAAQEMPDDAIVEELVAAEMCEEEEDDGLPSVSDA